MNSNGKSNYYNSSGCADPTAYEAIKKITQDEKAEKRAKTLLSVLKEIINMAGFDLTSKIEVRDRRTGKEYK